jgi:hypothetical protein
VREVLGTTASVQVFPQIVPVELVAVYQREVFGFSMVTKGSATTFTLP